MANSIVAVGALFSFCLVSAQVIDHKTAINDPEHIKALNEYNKANSTWTAGHNSFFDGLSFEDAKVYLGTALHHIDDYDGEIHGDAHYDVGDADVPASFDARQRWPGLIHPIRDQQRCGSCWAFSASEVLSDRVAIRTNKSSPALSPEDMVSCDTGDMGCSGGQLPAAWTYLTKTGIVSDSCFPYSAGTGVAPRCSDKCADGESWSASKVRASSAYAINGAVNMQKEIMTNGPVQVAFMVFKSFMSYKSGVYQRHWYEVLPEGGHAVKVIGWGTENSVDYWLVANSWNTTWGLDGLFKIRRGNNACGIEKMGPPYAGIPDVAASRSEVAIQV
jgi:cathepsin B